jgi:hypothetical protein
MPRSTWRRQNAVSPRVRQLSRPSELRRLTAIDPALADKVTRCKALFHTAGVSNTPRTIDAALCVNVTKLGYARLTVAAGSPDGVSIDEAQLACPLVIVDEADRLTIKSLEELRDLSDRHRFGLILMGMPGLEKRLARYAQFYSRIGFVHEFKPLAETEMRLLLATHAADFGIAFDPAQLDAIEAQAAVIRITRGNFRLMQRLFAQMRRIMTLNRVEEVTRRRQHREDRGRLPIKPPADRAHRLPALPPVPDLRSLCRRVVNSLTLLHPHTPSPHRMKCCDHPLNPPWLADLPSGLGAEGSAGNASGKPCYRAGQQDEQSPR